MHLSVCEGQKRVESILNFTMEDPTVMHVINWTRFCDLTRVVLLANICLHMSEELYNKLTADGTFNLSPDVYFRPEIMPSCPVVFMRAVESFHEKMLSIETKKLHLNMIEGNFDNVKCSLFNLNIQSFVSLPKRMKESRLNSVPEMFKGVIISPESQSRLKCEWRLL